MLVSEFFEITIRFDSDNKYNKSHFHTEYNNYKIIVGLIKY